MYVCTHIYVNNYKYVHTYAKCIQIQYIIKVCAYVCMFVIRYGDPLTYFFNEM